MARNRNRQAKSTIASSSSEARTRPAGRWILSLGFFLVLGVGVGLVLGYRYWLDIHADLERLNAAVEQAAREQAVLRQRVQEAQRAMEDRERWLQAHRRAAETEPPAPQRQPSQP